MGSLELQCFAVRKVAVCLASHQLCVTYSAVYPPMGAEAGLRKGDADEQPVYTSVGAWHVLPFFMPNCMSIVVWMVC